MGSSRPKPRSLSKKLAYIRKAFGLTQQQMVEALKRQQSNATVYPGNISRFEQGIREPPLLVLLAYAKFARTTIDTLVNDELDLPGPSTTRKVNLTSKKKRSVVGAMTEQKPRSPKGSKQIRKEKRWGIDRWGYDVWIRQPDGSRKRYRDFSFGSRAEATRALAALQTAGWKARYGIIEKPKGSDKPE